MESSSHKRISELENAREEKKIELVDYYEGEIEELEAYREKKKKILEK